MPSGAKKRKAAKKKMETNKPNSSSTLSHGDQESVAREIRDIKVENLSDNKDGKIEISEPNGKFCNGGSSGSSSNGSSDDESRVLKNGPAVSNNASFVDSARGANSLSETLDKEIHTSVKETDSVKTVEDKVANSADMKAAASDKNIDGTVAQPAMEGLLPEKNDITLLCNGVENVKDSGVTEPLLDPNLRPMEQKTSWKGCCGLFEVLMGSGR